MNFTKKVFSYFFRSEHDVLPVHRNALWLGSLLLLIAGIRVYYNIYDYMDIVFGDEVMYMKTGIDITHHFSKDWGPLYCLWYKLISLFFDDTIQLYYFNFVLVAILSTILIYIAFICIDIHPLVAFYFAICFISSKAVVPMWPRISLFTISILMTGIIIISRMQLLYQRLLVFSATLLIACYARPELYVSFIISVIIFIIYFFIDKLYKQKKVVRLCIGFIGFVILLHFIFKFPSDLYFGYPRSLAAFYQHYLINLFYQGKATEFDWIYWKDMHDGIFKNCSGIVDVIFKFPGKFFWHIWMNIRHYIIEIIMKNIAVIFPYFNGKNKLFLTGSLTVFSCSIIVLFFKKIRTLFVETLKKHMFYLIALFIWGIPTIVSSIVIFPREHYIMLNYFLFILPLGFLASIVVRQFQSFNNIRYLFLLGIVSIPFLSSCAYHRFFLTDNQDYYMCGRKALLHIKQKHLDKRVQYTFFADIHCFIGFLPDNFKEINTMFDKTKDIPFSSILQKSKPDFILVNNCINDSPSLVHDLSWKEFIKNPHLYGYHYEFEKDCPFYYLVRNSVYEN